ncbi:Ldh family oxidoreductase [Pseudarthrobacter sp. NS4]|uniref:Ldh family oxidoreductase n=1 Tax=Pseudarthrobacter sp. NS4 TaxID=2973976 RepID=UPI002162A166|nr:Ldh family oxidoreductase [Pseudarthrobacter sp. NS4]
MTETQEFLCSAEELEDFTTSVLRAVGTNETDASYMAGQIVGSELAGHESHGMRRLPEYVGRVREGHADPAASASIELDNGSLVRLNGNCGFGHTVLRDATELAVDRAKTRGISAVAVHNSEYAGRLSYFCEAAADAGMATLIFINDSGSGRAVAPPGGLEGRMSTNPIAAGIPRAQAPHLVLDIATSTVALGTLSEWRDRGEALPEGWVTPGGFLQPFGGHKGFGLALIAEALAGALTTAGTVSNDPAQELQGALIIAINIEQLRPLGDFANEVESFVKYINDTPVAEGADVIRVPGERSAENTEQRKVDGIRIKPFTWNAMEQVAEECNVPMPGHSRSTPS